MTQRCNNCGCTQDDACQVHGMSCCWITETVCSSCASIELITSTQDGRAWLDVLLAHVYQLLEDGQDLPGHQPCQAEQNDPLPEASEQRACDCHYLVLQALVDGTARWEADTRELCFGGLRYSMAVDSAGVPILDPITRSRLLAYREHAANAAR